jgi:hypothetical protein
MNAGKVSFGVDVLGGDRSVKILDKAITSLNNFDDSIKRSKRSRAEQADMEKQAIKWFKESDSTIKGMLKGVNDLSGAYKTLTRIQKTYQDSARDTVNKATSSVSPSESINKLHGQALEMNKRYDSSIATQVARDQERLNKLHGQALEMNKKIDAQRNKSIKKTSDYTKQVSLLTRSIDKNTRASDSWYERFIKVGVGFAIVYRAINTIQIAITELTNVFSSGVSKLDDYRQALGEVSGMLATLRDSGSFADAFNQNIKALAGTMERVTWLAPEFGLSTESIGNGVKELAQFGVVLEETQVRPFLATLTAIEQIASTTDSSAKQIRQEIQSIFNGQKRVTDQFGRYLDKIPELRDAIYGIDKLTLSSQEKWNKVLEEFGKDYATAIEFANARIGKQFSMIIERLSTISMKALKTTGLWDKWVGGLQRIYKALSDINSDEFRTVYEIFYTAWVRTNDLIKAVRNFGAVAVDSFRQAKEALAPYKDIILTTVKYFAYLKGAKILFSNIFGLFKFAVSPVTNVAVSMGQFYFYMLDFAKLQAGTVIGNIASKFLDLSKKILGGTLAISAFLAGWYLLDKKFNNSEAALSRLGEQLKLYNEEQEKWSSKAKEAEGAEKARFEKLADTASKNIDIIKNKIEEVNKKEGFGFSGFIDEQLRTMLMVAGDIIDDLEKKFSTPFKSPWTDITIDPPVFSENVGDIFPVQENLGEESWQGYYEKIIKDGRDAYKVMADDTKALADNMSSIWDDLWEGNIRTVGDLFDEMAKTVLDTFRSLMAKMTEAYFNEFLMNIVKTQDQDTSGSWLSILGKGALSLFSGGASNAISGSSAIMAGTGDIANSFFSGGVISEPVVGVGLSSGQSYSFAEKGPERILSNKDSFTQPSVNVTMNIVNNSSSQVKADQKQPKFDGKKMIIDVVLEDYHNGGLLYKSLGKA